MWHTLASSMMAICLFKVFTNVIAAVKITVNGTLTGKIVTYIYTHRHIKVKMSNIVIQWNLSNPDTLWTEESVLLVRCPDFGG